jgi:hypothetical protein
MSLLDVRERLQTEGIYGDVKLRGFCEDANDRLYTSKPLDVKLDEWPKSEMELYYKD